MHTRVTDYLYNVRSVCTGCMPVCDTAHDTCARTLMCTYVCAAVSPHACPLAMYVCIYVCMCTRTPGDSPSARILPVEFKGGPGIVFGKDQCDRFAGLPHGEPGLGSPCCIICSAKPEEVRVLSDCSSCSTSSYSSSSSYYYYYYASLVLCLFKISIHFGHLRAGYHFLGLYTSILKRTILFTILQNLKSRHRSVIYNR